MKYRINIVHAEDWEAVYINEELSFQDHRINPMEMMLYIKTKVPGSSKLNDLIIDEWWVDEKWMNQVQIFPKNFEDVRVRL